MIDEHNDLAIGIFYASVSGERYTPVFREFMQVNAMVVRS